jgi:outer membrane protein assembly factor BamB
MAVFVAVLCGADWPQFRGPNGASFSPDTLLSFGETVKDSVAWKAALPGRGASSPIVVGGRVFVTASSGSQQDRLHVLAFAADTGRELWHREFWATGRTLCHPVTAVATPTPASDGRRVFAFYSSNDLACLDHDGNLVWYRGLARDYPKAGNDAGMASSPAVVADTAVVQIENQGDSFAAGIDAATGETRWRIRRDPVANWSSPLALPGTGQERAVVLLQSSSGLTAHDARTGKEVWRYGVKCREIPSPAYQCGRLIVAANGLTALGVTDPSVAPSLVWEKGDLNLSYCSPVADDKHIYVMNSAGVLACADASTGSVLWRARVGGPHWGTPVVAGDVLCCVNNDGQVRIVQVGERGKILGSFDLGEKVLASPAVADGAVYVRSDSHLWKLRP